MAAHAVNRRGDSTRKTDAERNSIGRSASRPEVSGNTRPIGLDQHGGPDRICGHRGQAREVDPTPPSEVDDPRYQDPIAIRDYPEEVDRYLEPWLMQHTKEEVLELAQEYRIAITPIRTIDEVMHEPHFVERKSFVAVELENGKETQIPAVPYRFSTTPCRQPGNAPKLGEHNEEIYGQRLAHMNNDLATLKRTKVI